MSQVNQGTATFSGLLDLLAESMGGQALATNDEFFAEASNLVKPGRGIFDPDRYTDRGKWMDGWESRRKRGPGYDWCILKLGVPGIIRGLDIDTNHFLGNHAPYASLGAAFLKPGQSLDDAAWEEVLCQSALHAGSQNLFSVQSDKVATHVRLNIFPDGGVARLRVFGEVKTDWADSDDDLDADIVSRRAESEVDLVAARHGALALACSDMFFSSMNNLILPGRAANMGEGWETRRRRGPGFDWVLIRLSQPGQINWMEISTHHYKGNYPDRCMIEAIDAPDTRITDLMEADCRPFLPEYKLKADTRHFVRDELLDVGNITHLRLNIYPDGGISRLRGYGKVKG